MDNGVRGLLDKTIDDLAQREGLILFWDAQIADDKAELLRLQEALKAMDAFGKGRVLERV